MVMSLSVNSMTGLQKLVCGWQENPINLNLIHAHPVQYLQVVVVARLSADTGEGLKRGNQL